MKKKPDNMLYSYSIDGELWVWDEELEDYILVHSVEDDWTWGDKEDSENKKNA